MSTHITNSSTSSSSSRPAFERELAVFLGLCKTSLEFGHGLAIRTAVSSRHRTFDAWVNRKTVLNAFLDWLHTTDHKVNGSPTEDSVPGEWYCDSSSGLRLVVVPLQGHYVAVTFLSRTMNPDRMLTSKHYEIVLTKPE